MQINIKTEVFNLWTFSIQPLDIYSRNDVMVLTIFHSNILHDSD